MQLGKQSGGRQRFAQANGKLPTLTQEEWDHWLSGPVEAPRLRYGKEHKTDKALEEHPEGFLIDRDHPELKSWMDNADVFNIPGEGEGGPLFIRPRQKEPLTS